MVDTKPFPLNIGELTARIGGCGDVRGELRCSACGGIRGAAALELVDPILRGADDHTLSLITEYVDVARLRADIIGLLESAA